MNFPQTSVMLLARLENRADDPDAWSRFVAIYGPPILRWCRRYGLQEADAHDLAQEVFLQFSRQVGEFRYDPSKRFRGWLRKLVHASWYAWSLRRRPWQQGSGDDAVQARLLQEAAREDLLARLDAEFDRELFNIASEAIRHRVEPRTWAAFQLLAIEDLSGQEAAERLGMKLSTAFAARHKVQRMIREEVERLDLVR